MEPLVFLETSLYFSILHDLVNFHFQILDFGYHDATSVTKAKDFVSRCCSLLGSDSNLSLVAFQSNILADLYDRGDFQKKFVEIKEELTKEGWILPKLESNMRNQVNIAKKVLTKNKDLFYKCNNPSKN